jgi:hypothetical protein
LSRVLMQTGCWPTLEPQNLTFPTSNDTPGDHDMV